MPQPDPHQALQGLVASWRAARPEAVFPGFDPHSGGAAARVLALMESPGPGTIALGDAAISSEDNPGPTARTYRQARIASGLPREQVLRWNVVPWALNRPARESDLIDAAAHLAELLQLMGQLRVVVCFGAPALQGMMRHLTLDPAARIVPVLAVPHPSPANARRAAEKQQRILGALTRAAQIAADSPAGQPARTVTTP